MPLAGHALEPESLPGCPPVLEVVGLCVEAAGEMSLELKKQLSEAENVVRRLSKIALAARPPADAEPKPAVATISPAKAVAAAAQAFSERRRTDGLAA